MTTTAEKYERRFERSGRNAKGFKPWDHLNALHNPDQAAFAAYLTVKAAAEK